MKSTEDSFEPEPPVFWTKRLSGTISKNTNQCSRHTTVKLNIMLEGTQLKSFWFLTTDQGTVDYSLALIQLKMRS